VVLSPALNTVEGNVTDDNGRPSIGAQVVLVPADRRRTDLYARDTTDQAGHFKIGFVAPGNYNAFAWDDIEGFAYLDVNFLQQYTSRGVALRVGQRGTAALNLRALY
jgi:hypothetical protein